MPIKLRRIFMTVILLLLLIGILFSATSFIRGDWRLSYNDVQIHKLQVCSEPNRVISMNEGGFQTISSNFTYIYACGYLFANSPVELGFYLFKEPDTKSVDNNPAGEKLIEGNFNQALRLPNNNRQGHYRIDVYLFREVIASTTFEVIDP